MSNSNEHKVEVLHKSIGNLHTWLDKCQDSVVVSIPLEDFLEADPAHLTQLALQYKDLLLKLKERYTIIQEMKTLLKEIIDDNAKTGSNRVTSLECAKISKQLTTIHTKWSNVCQQVKQLYSKLSIALATISGRSPSPISSTGSTDRANSDRSQSPETENSKENGSSYSQLDNVVVNTPPVSSYSKRFQFPRSSNSLPRSTANSNESLDDLLDSLKQEAEEQQTRHSAKKSQTLPNKSRSMLHGTTPPPKNLQITTLQPSLSSASSESQHTPSPPPKPARVKGAGLQLPKSTDPLERLPSCRLSIKLKEMSAQINTTKSTLMKGVACLLNSKEIEARLSDMRGCLTLLDLQFEELGQLVKEADSIPTSPSPTRPSKATTTSHYTVLELACCKSTLLQLHKTVSDLQLVCNEEIHNMELTLDLVLQFETKSNFCQTSISSYMKVLKELQDCSVGEFSDNGQQLWATVSKSLDYLGEAKDLITSTSTFSKKKLLSLEPHYNGVCIREKVKSMEDHLYSISNESNSIILSAAANYKKFAQDTLVGVDRWIEKSEEELKSLKKEKKKVSNEFKQVKSQEISKYRDILKLTTEQLEYILKLSTTGLLHIPQVEEVRATKDSIANRKTKLEHISSDTEKLAITHKEEIELPLKEKIKPYDVLIIPAVNNKQQQQQKRKSGPVYTEIEAKTSSTPLPIHSNGPHPVYSEILVQPSKMNNTKSPIPIPKSLSGSPAKTTVQSSPERGLAFFPNSPSPPPTSISLKSPTEGHFSKLSVHSVKYVDPQSLIHSQPPVNSALSVKDAVYKLHDANDYDIPRPASLKTVLMSFIYQEYSQMATVVENANVFKVSKLEETLNGLSEGQAKQNSKLFLKGLHSCREALDSLHKKISGMEIPQNSLLSSLHDQKESINEIYLKLDELNQQLSDYNNQTVHLHASLSTLPLDCERVDYIVLELESELFDVSVFHYRCQMLAREKVQVLKEREKDLSCLQANMELLSQSLKNAQDLLSQKDSITNVQDYLNQCKDMHLRLAQQSSLRHDAATKIRNLLLSSTHTSSASESDLRMLEQLKDIEMQWVNAVHDLMNMNQLEPILIKQMLQNIGKNLKTVEPLFSQLDCDGIDVEYIKERKTHCEEKISYFTALSTSLKAQKHRIEYLQSVQGNEPVYDHPRMFTSPLPDTDSTVSSPTIIKSTSALSEFTFSDPKAQFQDKKHQSESFLPSKQTSIGSVHYDIKTDYNKLIKTTSVMIDLVGRILIRLETKLVPLKKRIEILEQFWNESAVLSEWIESAKVDIKEKKGITEDKKLLAEVMTLKKQMVSSLKESAEQILAVTSAVPEHKEAIKARSERLSKEWQSMVRLLPLSLQVMLYPSNDSLSHLTPPEEFEDMIQMVEWLILVESKLQPRPLLVGQTADIKKELADIKAIETEMNKKSEEFHRFMKSGRHSDHSDSDGSSPTTLRSSSPPKTVKFVDENTIERHHRKKQIEQDNILDTILSEDELEITSSTPSSTRESKKSQAVSSPPSVISPTVEDTQQLSVIWNGIWSTLKQRKQMLESVLDIWSGFESKKMMCEQFLDRAESRITDLFGNVRNALSIEQLQKEMTELKMLSEETQLHQHKIGTLNDLTTDLIQRHKATDNAESLQQSMTLLNIRWKKVNESFSKSRTAVEQVTTAWAIFYKQYHPLAEFVKLLNAELTNIDTSVKDMLVMQRAIEKLKFTQKDLVARSGSLGVLKQHNVKLQEVVGNYMPELKVVNKNIDDLKKQWDTLMQLTEEKYKMMEKGFSERRDLLSILSRSETWIKMANEHFIQIKLTADLHSLNSQKEDQKEFEKELNEKETQLSLAMARARHMTSNYTTPHLLMDNMNSEELKIYFEGIENSFKEIGKLSEKWKKDIECALAGMDEFQLLSTQFSQNIDEVQTRLPENLQLAFTLPELKRQLESWQQMEASTNGLGRVLEAMVASQKKLMELGVQISGDAVHLVKIYHKQWNNLRKTITTFMETIKETIVKFDPNNVAMTLPRGWTKAKTPQGTPYYIDTLSGNHTQWQHPELSELYRSFVTQFRHSFYPSPAYPVSLRLRCIQKCIQFEHLPTQIAIETFDVYNLQQDPHAQLSTSEMMEILLSLFHKTVAIPSILEDDMGGTLLNTANVDINRAVELSVSWIHDVFDLSHSGFVSAMAFEIATVCLSSTKMDDKHKALFQIMSRGKTTVDKISFMTFLDILVQIPQSMSDTQYCSVELIEKHVEECFRKYATGTQLHSVGYVAWAQAEPLPIAWLPILHRMAAAEMMEHAVKCSVCRSSTIIGFRYKCLQCANFNMCQECYWSGKTAKEHDRTRHFMEEYCISPDERGLFFRTLGNRKKKSSRRGGSEKHLTSPVRKTSQTDYHLIPLNRDQSPSLSSLSTISSSLGAVPLERRGSFSHIPNAVDPLTSYGMMGPVLDETQRVKKLRYEKVKESGSSHLNDLPVSQSFDYGRRTNETTPPPPLPPRNIIKKRELEGSFESPRSLNSSPSHGGIKNGSSSLHGKDLRERVEMLESHNKQLEDYIFHLKSLQHYQK